MKGSSAIQIIKRQGMETLKEVKDFFESKSKPMSEFEYSFLLRMAKDCNLTSKELGIDTVISYRKALINRQQAVTTKL